jgi:hypothetical protein
LNPGVQLVPFISSTGKSTYENYYSPSVKYNSQPGKSMESQEPESTHLPGGMAFKREEALKI